MNRKTIVSLLTTALLSNALSLWAQQPKKFLLGYLSAFSAPSVTGSNANVESLRQGLRTLGWVEGVNVSIEYRWAEGKYERLPDLATELVRLKMDVIVTNAPYAAVAAKNATRTIPIVFETLGDPVSTGLVASLARPGGNLTGVAGTGPELSGKQVELLKEVVPQLTRLAVLVNPANLGITGVVRETELAAKSLGVRVQMFKVEESDQLDVAFPSMRRGGANALFVPADAMLATQRKRILALVEKARLPAMYVETPSWVINGGLMSYSASLPDQFRKAAIYVDKILKGAKPADLPVQQPTKFELMINLNTAKQIGLTIPPNVLARADKVIR
jgi:putative tryptophan/tyrosine transport system substrate-binding protein